MTAAATVWVLTDDRYLRQRMPLAVIEWLLRRMPCRLVVADEGSLVSELASARFFPHSAWRSLNAGDIVVTRSRHPFALALLEQAESLGARARDSSASIFAVRNKVRCTIALAARGLPVPPTFLARRPHDLRSLPSDVFPLLLKPVLGDNARGIAVVSSAAELGTVEWHDDLVLAQRYVDADGVDLKVYVAGTAIWAVRRASPLAAEGDRPVRVRVTTQLLQLAQACRDAFGLQLFGIDVLESRDGPLIVDVNEFPNYSGIDEAPAEIGRLLVAELRARRPLESRLRAERV
jgi:ribosomal protein S6--L-glutamate ligase